MNKKRNFSLDLIRCLCVITIINFHFCTALSNTDSVFYGYANGGWGSVATTMFYLISGYVMMLCHPQDIDLKQFYKKRALAIFPILHLTFLCGYLYNSIKQNNFLYGGSPWRFVFSFLGIDGYASMYGIQTYYIIGEWFTGVILVCYLVYPLLNFLLRKYCLPSTIIIMGTYFANIVFPLSKISPDASISTGILLFWLGMLTYRYQTQLLKWRKIIIPITLSLIALITMVKLPFYQLPWKNVLGISIFSVLYLSLNKIEPSKYMTSLIRYVCKISYPIYLCHHMILNICVAQIAPNTLRAELLTLLFIYICILICSSLIYVIAQRLLKLIIA